MCEFCHATDRHLEACENCVLVLCDVCAVIQDAGPCPGAHRAPPGITGHEWWPRVP